MVPEVEELREGGSPEKVVRENALRKARAGLALVAGEGRSREVPAGLGQVGEGAVPALGVDTEVVLDGHTLGKAANKAEARTRLEALSGRTHAVLSGVALVGCEAVPAHTARKSSHAAGIEERVGVARTYVTFHELDEAVLGLYLRSNEWHDRAGAYAIQGLGAILVERLQGDISNVIGLPVALLLELAPELEIRGERV